MKKKVLKWYYTLFPKYKRLEMKFIPYGEADLLLKQNKGKTEDKTWQLAVEEDTNSIFGMVYLERKVRIYE